MGRMLVSIAMLLVVSGCENYPAHLVTEATEYPVIRSWLADLAPDEGDAEVDGTVRTDEFGSYMIAEADLSGVPPNTPLQWRFFFGSCADTLETDTVEAHGPNANPPAYPVIVADGGSATVEATVMGRLEIDSTYHVRVYDTIPEFTDTISEDSMVEYPEDTIRYACGDFALQ